MKYVTKKEFEKFAQDTISSLMANDVAIELIVSTYLNKSHDEFATDMKNILDKRLNNDKQKNNKTEA